MENESVSPKNFPLLPQTRLKQDGFQLYTSVENRSSTARAQSPSESHMIDSSVFFCMRPLLSAT